MQCKLSDAKLAQAVQANLLHASAACLDNALLSLAEGQARYCGSSTRPSVYVLVVHVLTVSRSASPICTRCPVTASTRLFYSPPHRDPSKQAFESSIQGGGARAGGRLTRDFATLESISHAAM
jgi:hypothetical protein